MMHGHLDPDARRKFFDDLAARWDDIHPYPEQLPAVRRGLEACGALDNATVVDVGCGTGIVTRELLSRVGQGRVIALDLSSEMLARAARAAPDPRVEFIHGEVISCGIAAGSVDAVLCYNTFPHFQDRAAAVRELVRWLRPAGRVLIWHDAGRAAINAIHHQVGGAVAHDMLPPAREVAALLEHEGLSIVAEEDLSDRYMVFARLASGTGHAAP